MALVGGTLESDTKKPQHRLHVAQMDIRCLPLAVDSIHIHGSDDGVRNIARGEVAERGQGRQPSGYATLGTLQQLIRQQPAVGVDNGDIVACSCLALERRSDRSILRLA